jgi:hypothetical protein
MDARNTRNTRNTKLFVILNADKKIEIKTTKNKQQNKK